MYSTIIIGSGPSGLMAAIKASSSGKKTLLIEKNNVIGKKLLITGGGRCNVTNLKYPNKFLKEIHVNYDFLKHSISKFGPHKIHEYFTGIGVNLKVEDNDRIFPESNLSEDIINSLKNELVNNSVEILYNTNALSVQKDGDVIEVITNKGNYKCENVVIATGSFSFPKTGSTGDGYKLAQSFDQPLTDLYPTLTSIDTVNKLPLVGITLDNVTLRINDIVKDGSVLFTHKGLSGPAAFKISEHVYKELQNNKVATVYANFLPTLNSDKLIKGLQKYDSKREIKSFVREYLPNRFADYIIDYSNIVGSKKIAEISNKDKFKLINNIFNFPIDIKSTGKIEHSIVTGGGVDISLINPETMESLITSNVYYVGEILDVHGPTGGYNITIALSTGYIAGSHIATK